MQGEKETGEGISLNSVVFSCYRSVPIIGKYKDNSVDDDEEEELQHVVFFISDCKLYPSTMYNLRNLYFL